MQNEKTCYRCHRPLGGPATASARLNDHFGICPPCAADLAAGRPPPETAFRAETPLAKRIADELRREQRD